MEPLSDFFTRNIIGVYFFYGLSFFSMGVSILLEMGHSSELGFSDALPPLAAFGLLHGGHEWLEMLLLINPDIVPQGQSWINILRLLLLAASFLLLITFGTRLIAKTTRTAFHWTAILMVIGVWLVGLFWVSSRQPAGIEQVIAADVYTRYALAIPGAALSAWGLLLQRRQFIQMGMAAFGNDVAGAALAFGLYGGIGQLFASPSHIFPSDYLNTEVFMRWFGFPVQVFRASMAMVAAIFIIRSLRAFEVESHRRILALQDAQRAERRRLEALRAQLLHQTVKAQESERQRIARELHDETGQTLTALGMGLRGLSGTIQDNPARAIQHAKQLEILAVSGVQELQRMIGGLHPPQLDDLGLAAALRWYASEAKSLFGLQVQFNSRGPAVELTTEIRTVFFRIAQEAITNVVRHSGASQASILLETSPDQVVLEVHDNGRGFDVSGALKATDREPSWGLLGMMERAELIGAECRILSKPGEGVQVRVILPLEPPTAHA